MLPLSEEHKTKDSNSRSGKTHLSLSILQKSRVYPIQETKNYPIPPLYQNRQGSEYGSLIDRHMLIALRILGSPLEEPKSNGSICLSGSSITNKEERSATGESPSSFLGAQPRQNLLKAKSI